MNWLVYSASSPESGEGQVAIVMEEEGEEEEEEATTEEDQDNEGVTFPRGDDDDLEQGWSAEPAWIDWRSVVMMMMVQEWSAEPAWIDWRSVVVMMMKEQEWSAEPAWIDWRSVVVISEGAGLIGWTSMNWLEGTDITRFFFLALTHQRLVLSSVM